jgi:hypothetical protein
MELHWFFVLSLAASSRCASGLSGFRCFRLAPSIAAPARTEDRHPGVPCGALPSESFRSLNEHQLEAQGYTTMERVGRHLVPHIKGSLRPNLNMIMFAAEPAGFEGLSKTMQDHELKPRKEE